MADRQIAGGVRQHFWEQRLPNLDFYHKNMLCRKIKWRSYEW